MISTYFAAKDGISVHRYKTKGHLGDTQDSRVPNSSGLLPLPFPIWIDNHEFPGETVGTAVHVDCGGLSSNKFVCKVCVSVWHQKVSWNFPVG